MREIWRSPLIASDPLVWRKDLDDNTKKLVRDFMLNYGKDAREKAILANIDYSGFRASSDAQLMPIRQIELARSPRDGRGRHHARRRRQGEEAGRTSTRSLADLGRQIAARSDPALTSPS